ncbi:hypothetical protein [Caenimonas soli]|uniref:hypothetical protein n=1 Tax=Caenimonas soli TaxID=2735555 RepID=UPI001552D111|nr:hypothetical protein [Caenimonas soli]NPC59379.1 hypothetical protein [Caenimonas soli]
MSAVQSASAGGTPSPWRLVNLALGIAALVKLASEFHLVAPLVPSRWLLAPWLTNASMTAVPTFAALLAKIGINLWLPASIFMVIFWLAGLHRKLGAPRVRFASAVLTLGWVIVFAAASAPLLARSQGAFAAVVVLAMFLAPAYAALGIALVVAAAVELAVMLRHSGSTQSRASVALLSWAVLPPLLSVVPMVLAPSNPIVESARENNEFASLCKDVGVQLTARPVAPVRSLAYDWDRQRFSERPFWDFVELDGKGQIQSYGSGPISLGAAGQQKKPTFEFTERPVGDRPGFPYAHFPVPNTGQAYGVKTLSADVLAFLDVDKPEELKKAPVQQGAVRYRLTLTDRRSGEILGVYTYVVDMVNKRACGTNMANAISQDAFIYDAINR